MRFHFTVSSPQGKPYAMSQELKILQPEHKDAILTFARGRLTRSSHIAEDATPEDPMEIEMKSWSARWRAEALDHYLRLGWSFGSFEIPAGAVAKAEPWLNGFLLAQPYLFHRGLTQTLWIESLECERPDIAKDLLDTVYRWARDKHFQCVLIESGPAIDEILTQWAPRVHATDPVLELRSARF